MNKLILNFFGEEVTVETPKTLENLRKEISDKFFFSPSDAAEMLLSYFNDIKKVFIKTEQDFVDFVKKKIYKVDLDINPESQLYKNSVIKIQEETERDKKDLEVLLKIKEELEKKKTTFTDEKTKEVLKCNELIEKLKKKKQKLVKEIKKQTTEMDKEIKKTDNQIVDLQKKLSIPVQEKPAKPKSAKEPKKTKVIDKKIIKKVVKKKIAKKPKEEKNMFTKVNDTINKMVNNITKVVSAQLKKKTKEVEVEKKKIEESQIKLEEKEQNEFLNFKNVAKNVYQELNKWTKYVSEHTNELTNKLSEKYKNCLDVITSINKREEKKEDEKEVKEKLKALPKMIKGKTKIHKGIACKGCGIKSIIGNRFKCAICPSFDYCQKCEEKNKDLHLHPFIKIYSPELAPIDIKCELK